MVRVRALVCLSLVFVFSCIVAPSFASNIRKETENRAGEKKEAQNRRWLRRSAEIVAGMDRSVLAAQLILTAVDGRDLSSPTTALLNTIPTGGIMIFRYNIGRDPQKTKNFIAALEETIRASSAVKPFVAADQEGGTVQRFRGDAELPAPLSYWDRVQAGAGRQTVLEAVYADAAAAGTALRSFGVNLNLAPVVEILSGENGRFLKTRSYGPEESFVKEAAGAFVRGMEEQGIACTLKHFPGNSGADPHRRKAVLDISKSDLDRYISPFASVIREDDPAAVMISHVIVPSWDSKPASLSSAALAKLRSLGFRGIAIADDFTMAAAGAPAAVCAVEAVNAGVDMVMSWPGDLAAIHGALVKSLENGTLKEARVREAAQRIIYQKLRYGLIPEAYSILEG
ncbi:MAG: glycoside hydrolase family 3 protein [Treponema sp.]|jgi:beta-N-acetylhexosaminidase|nr:glycoside hydrolase family 3 protein [Treponema sp.]